MPKPATPAPPAAVPNAGMRFAPLPPDTKGRRSNANAERLEFLRTKPGQWACVFESASQHSAWSCGNALRAVAVKMGAVVETTTRGKALWARLVK